MSEDTSAIETEEQDILAGKIKPEDIQSLSKNRKSIHLEGEVVKRENVRVRYLASCGHLIHNLSEVGGQCQQKDCSAIMCTNCSKVCQRCMKLICPRHQKIHQGLVYCPRCWWIRFFFGRRIEDGERRVRRGDPWYSKSIGDYLFK